ncbi:hypothetical protein DTO195F2_3736 [Paecilomyces variotii]|nr:hypothetical protein DTO195F2_3736 [Paecilomyces variotii]
MVSGTPFVSQFQMSLRPPLIYARAGAAIGTEAFTPIQDNLGKKWTFIIAAICGVVGVLVTWFFVPDISGEDLKYRDEQFRAYLVAHGWDGEMGEDDLKAIADQGIPPAVTEGGGRISANANEKA